MVRASRDVPKGAEILISYAQEEERSFEHRASFLERHLESKGCGCRACEADAMDGGASSRRRVEILAEVEGTMFSIKGSEAAMGERAGFRRRSMALPGVEGSIFSTEGSLSDKIAELFVGRLPRQKLLDDLVGLLPEYQSLVNSLNATYAPSYTAQQPSLFGPARAMSDILALQINPRLVLRSIDAAIAAFSCLGFKFYDMSPTTMVDVSSPLLIDFADSEFILTSEAPHLFYSVLLSLSRVELPKRRASWMRTFRRYEEILSGGGEEFFRLRHGEQTDSMTYTYVFGGVCTLTMRA